MQYPMWKWNRVILACRLVCRNNSLVCRFKNSVVKLCLRWVPQLYVSVAILNWSHFRKLYHKRWNIYLSSFFSLSMWPHGQSRWREYASPIIACVISAISTVYNPIKCVDCATKHYLLSFKLPDFHLREAGCLEPLLKPRPDGSTEWVTHDNLHQNVNSKKIQE